MSYFTRDEHHRLVRIDSTSTSSPTPSLPLVVDLGFIPMANPNEPGLPNIQPLHPNVQINPKGHEEFERGSHHGDVAAPPIRILRDYLNPPKQAPTSCIVFPPHHNTLNIRSGMMQMLPQSHGMDSEQPYIFLKEFEDTCSIAMDNSCPRVYFC